MPGLGQSIQHHTLGGEGVRVTRMPWRCGARWWLPRLSAPEAPAQSGRGRGAPAAGRRSSRLWQRALLDHIELVCAQSAEDGALDSEGVLLPRKIWPKPDEGLQVIISTAD